MQDSTCYLQNLAARYGDRLENFPDPAVLLDSDGRLCDANDSWVRILGYDRREEVLGRGFGEFLSEGSRRVFRDCLACFRTLGYVSGQDLELVRKDGTRVLAVLFGNIVGDRHGDVARIHCIMRDVTEARRSEELLRQSEERFRTAFEYAPIGMALLGLEGGFLQVNLALCRMLGYSMEELLSMDFQTLSHPEDLEQSVRAAEEMLAGGIYTTQLEKRYIHKDGHSVWVLLNASLVRNGDNTPLHFITQIQDITDRKRTEQELALLAAACEQAAEGLAILNMERMIHFVNPAFERLTGVPQGNAVGRPWSRMALAVGNERALLKLWGGIERGEVSNERLYIEDPEGQPRELDTTVFPIRDEHGAVTHCVMVLRDVTREREMEAHLRQAQKMEAIGTLAGGIAHDFNNILAAILGYTELALLRVQEDKVLERNLEQVFKAANRARDLVQQILAFSRQREQPLKPLQMSIVIKEVLKLLRASLPSTIEIQQRIMSNSYISGDPTQIHQVVMNLCTNAAHAMKDGGGTLTLTLEDVGGDSKALSGYGGVEEGDYVMLEVSDTGHGMSESVMERVFDPFFTTKGPGEGTGMGLAVVHGIVKSHRGAVSVESELGRGAAFKILFPKFAAEQRGEDVHRLQNIQGGKESVLVVDDETTLVETMRQMLEHLGYAVTVSSSSQEALHIFAANPSGFDLLITDQTMPGLTGVELAGIVSRIRGDLPVILCSGHSDALELKGSGESNIKASLTKPLLMADLAAAVRAALAESSSGGA